MSEGAILIMLILCGVTFVILGDIALMSAARDGGNHWFLLGAAACWTAEIAPWYAVMQRVTLSWLSVVYSVSVLLGMVLAGVLVFRDRLTIWQTVGIGLGVVAVALMQVGA